MANQSSLKKANITQGVSSRSGRLTIGVPDAPTSGGNWVPPNGIMGIKTEVWTEMVEEMQQLTAQLAAHERAWQRVLAYCDHGEDENRAVLISRIEMIAQEVLRDD